MSNPVFNISLCHLLKILPKVLSVNLYLSGTIRNNINFIHVHLGFREIYAFKNLYLYVKLYIKRTVKASYKQVYDDLQLNVTESGGTLY